MCTGPHPYIPVFRVARLSLQFEQEGQQIENVMHFERTVDWTAGDLMVLCTQARDSWNTHLAPVVAANVAMTRIVATDLSTETSPSVELATPGIIGTSTGTPAPNGLSLRIRVTTALRSAMGRGGPYHLGMVIDDLEPTNKNDVRLSRADAIRAAWASFVDDTEVGLSCILAIVSLCYNNTWRSVGVATPYLNISYSDLHLDRQWRRMPGRGS